MKKLFFSLFTYFVLKSVGAQSVSGINIFLEDKIKSDLGINDSVSQVYSYTDKEGEHLLVLTERIYKTENSKPLIDTIKVVCAIKTANGFRIKWEMSDFLMKRNEANLPETSIRFWKKYIQLQDIDKDDIVEPVIVYGTMGKNGKDDGRIRILIYYKGQKYALRHQNGSVDYQRFTRVDKAFFSLPVKIRENIKSLMDIMTENNDAIFPYHYKKNIDNKKTYFDDK